MASSSSSSFQVKFIEKALLAAGSFALSYTDPDQKWLIRKHLISFLQEFPNFDLSTDTFNHNNGTSVQIFHLEGSLHFSKLPSIELTIWVHENYPLTPPLVFINPPNSIPIRTNHPFVNSSGLTNSNYIENWEHPRCNLVNFIRNLRKVLSNDHPFVQTDPIPTRILSVSKPEALDRLATSLHYDVSRIVERSEEEIENLWKLQSEMKKRSELVETMVSEFEMERDALKERVTKVEEEADVLEMWVERNYRKVMEARLMDHVGIEEMFEIDSEVENLARDDAIEDVLRVLEEAVERRELEIGLYLRQVRVLAREQFFCRDDINHHTIALCKKT